MKQVLFTAILIGAMCSLSGCGAISEGESYRGGYQTTTYSSVYHDPEPVVTQACPERHVKPHYRRQRTIKHIPVHRRHYPKTSPGHHPGGRKRPRSHRGHH